MTKEQEAIEYLKESVVIYKNTIPKLSEAVETVLNIIKKKDKEIEQKDNAIRKVINRLNNDIERITQTKADGKHDDDYSRCRLKAYRTKTREIKEYIEEHYFERKSKE